MSSELVVNDYDGDWADKTGKETYEKRHADSECTTSPGSHKNIGNLSKLRKYEDQSCMSAHPWGRHVTLEHVQYLCSNSLDNSTKHHELKVEGFVLASEYGYKKLS